LLLLAVILQAGFSVVGLTLAGLLGWSVLIYASATGYALGDPTRAPIGEGLRAKARLEIAPRVGRLANSRPARTGAAGAGLVALAIAGLVALESTRAPIALLPFNDVPAGPIGALAGPPRPSSGGGSAATPESSTTPPPSSGGADAGSQPASSGLGPAPTSTPRPTGVPAAPPARTPAPTATRRPTQPVPTPTPIAPPTPPPSPRRPPPVPIPSPTAHPTPPPSPGRTPPPHPTASPPKP
jgi:hypothetical protein